MTPSKEEVEAALKWAESRVQDDWFNGAGKQIKLLAAALRQAEAENESLRAEVEAAWVVNYKTERGALIKHSESLLARAEKAEAEMERRTKSEAGWINMVDSLRPRLKTLEEENARMRFALEKSRCGWYPNTDLCQIPGQTCQRCAALKQEAE